MYDMKFLCKIPYFKSFNINTVIDSLTGVINKTYMINYINQLIYEKKSFSLALIDIDNFKIVNDTWGHHVGDLALHEISKQLVEYVGSNGVVGRFGGDEFLVVYFNHLDYEGQHSYISDLFRSEMVVRRNYNLDGNDLFITATAGSASFPKDATNYYDLFHMVDQALYRGKMKGRNCYIIYVYEKHKDIDVFRNVRVPLYKMFVEINDILDTDEALEEKTAEIFEYLDDKMNIYASCIIDMNMKIHCLNNKLIDIPNISKEVLDSLLDSNGYCSIRKIEITPNIPKELVDYSLKYNVHSILMTRIERNDNVYGYMLMTENKIERIWQENDLALVEYISRLLSFEYETIEKKADNE